MMKALTLNRLREKQISITTAQVDHIVLMFFTGCLIGWVWEILYVGIVAGDFHNRGFLYGPWLPIYGFGCVLMMGIKHFSGDKLSFGVTSIGVCAIVEYATSWVLETLFHARWWDYSMELFNLHGRICLKGLIFFALAGGLFVYLLEPKLRKLTGKMNPKVRHMICGGLLASFAFDVAMSVNLPNLAPTILN